MRIVQPLKMIQASNQPTELVRHQVSALTRKESIMKRGEHKRELLPTVFTVGHSTRSLEAFIGLLKEHCVKKVVDIRTLPRSRHNPQFDRETLPDDLKAAKIGYVHIAGLGGLRRRRRDSPNTGWHNSSFRGFADYMQAKEFEKSLGRLIKLAMRQQVALMCAEAVPWRCHRSLVADALKVRGINVEHIMSSKKRQPHEVTPWARVHGTQITYPPPEGSNLYQRVLL